MTDLTSRVNSGTIRADTIDALWSSPVARRAHNPEVAGAKPASAIHTTREEGPRAKSSLRPFAFQRRSRCRPSATSQATTPRCQSRRERSRRDVSVTVGTQCVINAIVSQTPRKIAQNAQKRALIALR